MLQGGGVESQEGGLRRSAYNPAVTTNGSFYSLDCGSSFGRLYLARLTSILIQIKLL